MLIGAALLAGARDARAQTGGVTTPEFDLRAPAGELPQLRSLLVSWRGRLVADYHAHGVRPDAPANVKSASKSIISALVGIAIDRGLIKSVAEPIATYFPELRRDADPRKHAIRVEDRSRSRRRRHVVDDGERGAARPPAAPAAANRRTCAAADRCAAIAVTSRECAATASRSDASFAAYRRLINH